MPSKMKVIHILNELKFSGAEIMYVAAAPIFQKLGCELSVVNTQKNMGSYALNFEKAGFQVLHMIFPQSIIGRWIYYYRMIHFLRKNHYDVMHIHRNDMKWGMALCARIAGCKSVYTFHSIFYSRTKLTFYYHWWSRWAAQKLFRCTFQTISDSVHDHERNYYHTETVKIYNWYNNHLFYPAKDGEKEAIRTELSINQNSLVITSVGGCSSIKRHTEIIQALSLIVKKYPDAVYLHIGEGSSLPEEQQMVNELNLENNVWFCGNQNHVRKYLIAADIYVMTSQLEGISLTTIESMACEIPAVLYDVQGLREFNKEKTCAVLSPEDHKQLAENIIRLFEDKNRQKELVAFANQFVNQNFDMQTNATKIFRLYQKD